MARGKSEIQPLTPAQMTAAGELTNYLWDVAAQALGSVIPDGEWQEILLEVGSRAMTTWRQQTEKFIRNPGGVRILEPEIKITKEEIPMPANDPSINGIEPWSLVFGAVKAIIDSNLDGLLPETVPEARPQTKVWLRALFPSSRTRLEKIYPELLAKKEELESNRFASSSSRKTKRAELLGKAIERVKNTTAAEIGMMGRVTRYNRANEKTEAYDLIAARVQIGASGLTQATVKRLIIGPKDASLVDSWDDNPFGEQMKAWAGAMNFVEGQLLKNGEGQPGTVSKLAS